MTVNVSILVKIIRIRVTVLSKALLINVLYSLISRINFGSGVADRADVLGYILVLLQKTSNLQI